MHKGGIAGAGFRNINVGLAPLVGRSPWLRAAAVTAGFGVLLSLPGVLGEPTGLLLVAEGDFNSTTPTPEMLEGVDAQAARRFVKIVVANGRRAGLSG